MKGGVQWDNFWVDVSDTIADASQSEMSEGYVHTIASFHSIKYSSGHYPIHVGLEPNGENLPDPLPHNTTALAVQKFDNYPLFASAGPSTDDVFQGAAGDCYFVARLSALAAADPEFIRKTIAPLGDVTYAVRFERDGFEDYVRVDADLWIDGPDLHEYAGLGQEGALWAALIEKAYAIARNDEASYSSINGGNGTTLSKLPIDKKKVEIDDGLTKEVVKNWHDSGEPDGAIKTKIHNSTLFLLYVIRSQLEVGIPLITGSVSGVSDNTPIRLDDPLTSANESTYRRGQHIYAINHVLSDPSGVPYALVLRDPWGIYRAITDFTHIHYNIGSATLILY